MESIISFFTKKVAQYPNNTLLWEKDGPTFKPTTYSEALSTVQYLALGLRAYGIKPEQRVALLSEGRNLWLISELAVLSNRAITVPLSTKLEADNDLIFRLQHSESSYIITSQNQLPKVRKIKENLSQLDKIIVFKPNTVLHEDELDIQQIIDTGKEIIAEDALAYKTLSGQVKPGDIATITYTSGTTAQPKGIMLTQRNYTANIEQAFSYIDIPAYYRTLVVLPWDHAFAHTAALYSFMDTGASIASVQVGATQLETLKNFSNNIKEIQPHVLMSVPAMAKNFKKNIEKGIAQKGKATQHMFRWALAVSYWYNGTGNNKGRGIKWIAKPLIALFEKLIFSKIKIGFGGNLRFFIGGGALLDLDLQQFFYAIGLPMYQGYGLSEASPIISANTPRYHKLGSSGKVVNHLQIKICDNNGVALSAGQTGEIVVKGENVMHGYWRNPEATKETIKDGWLFTGDLGYLDKDNYLYVKGRFKSLLIGSDGEKYSPEGIEEAIVDHCELIDQIMLYNNQNAYTTAIVVPNIEKVKGLLKQYTHAQIITMIDQELGVFKAGGKLSTLFPQRWLPSTFAIASEPFSEQNKLINSTMKMVRDKVAEMFHNEIELCYTPTGKKVDNLKNIENLKLLLQ
ncbi:long-chain acyl-CoA synthetase [Saccharicrinis carchari]|uniref:Long-chain acyl-CoA synthetase n=1 Tax=Saccharicrinis carchari TaxID=1168039 RepID=A0A521BYJ1_SACCC|nr:AMP-binding protein [Saccharicrinis carchari]SMO52257.1 long-chain acyl-CoA synthetase [Saccharicrinis carchari]